MALDAWSTMVVWGWDQVSKEGCIAHVSCVIKTGTTPADNYRAPPTSPNHLDMSDTFDSAVWACATAVFIGVSRLSIFCLATATFDHTKFATRADIQFAADPQGNEYFSVQAPWTKTNGYKGATILVSRQERECDPVNVAVHHIIINNILPSSAPLFSSAAAAGWFPMRKEWFLNRCNKIWQADGLLRITGHSFRIVGAAELLSRGVPLEIVAKQGHWQSDAFLRYWRRIELVLP